MLKPKKTLLIILTSILLACIGIRTLPENKQNNEETAQKNSRKTYTNPLSYSIERAYAFAEKKVQPFNYSATKLKLMAAECGTEYPKNHFDELVSKFKGTNSFVYEFNYIGETPGSKPFKVTVLPNKAKYTTLEAFKKDFDQCFAGGDSYPTMLNEDWLLLESSCSTGFDNGSNKLFTCQKIKDLVSPTLKLIHN